MIVNVDYDTLLAKTGRAVELGSREPLCGEAARRLACDAGSPPIRHAANQRGLGSVAEPTELVLIA